MKKSITVIFLFLSVTLFLYPDAVMEGAYESMLLCGKKLIPSLFPFLVLSSLLVESGMIEKMGKFLSPVMKPLFGVSGNGALPLFLGIFGGYPVGIRTAAELYARGDLSYEDYSRLSGYVNNAGPLFILGTVGVGFFSDIRYGYILLFSHILATFLSSFLFRFYVPKKVEIPKVSVSSAPSFSLARVMEKSISSILSVSGFVVLFGAFLKLFEAMGLLNLLGRLFTASPDALSRGLFEMTSGLRSLSPSLPPTILLPLAGAILGWGGLCVHLQAVSLMEEYAFFSPSYFAGKLLSSAFTALFAFFFAGFLPQSMPAGISGIYPEIISPKDLTVILLVFLVSASLLFRFVATRKK